MPIVDANQIRLFFDEAGPSDAPAILLVMGLGAQLIFWPDELVRGLAARGFRVVRFDNRDTGLSERLDGARAPHPLLMAAAAALGLPLRPSYRLDDMARDMIGLMDVLGLARAHVVGASMGGMIAQTAAAHFPDRVRSLTSIMSTTGDPRLPKPSRKLVRHILLARPSGDERAAAIEHGIRLFKLIGTADPMRRSDDLRALIARAYDRGHYPQGVRRQLAAIIASGSRVALLEQVRAPTLVIHGSADPLVPAAGGIDTARRISGARLEIIEGMGHDLPPSKLPQLVELIAAHATAADRMHKAALG